MTATVITGESLAELRKLAPVDKRFRQFIRYGKYKAVIGAGGEFQLYDMLHPKSGIGEQAEVSADRPDIVKSIEAHLSDNKITERYYTMPIE